MSIQMMILFEKKMWSMAFKSPLNKIAKVNLLL